MRRYLVNGWAEPATESGPPKRTWYLPHHAVYKGEGEERKCRVVFDGSARYGYFSEQSAGGWTPHSDGPVKGSPSLSPLPGSNLRRRPRRLQISLERRDTRGLQVPTYQGVF
ncbi:hypothetical protein T08_4851, partial [Trichinella sp. T8]